MGFIKMFKKEQSDSKLPTSGASLDAPPIPPPSQGDLLSKDITKQMSTQARADLQPIDDFEVPAPPEPIAPTQETMPQENELQNNVQQSQIPTLEPVVPTVEPSPVNMVSESSNLQPQNTTMNVPRIEPSPVNMTSENGYLQPQNTTMSMPRVEPSPVNMATVSSTQNNAYTEQTKVPPPEEQTPVERTVDFLNKSAQAVEKVNNMPRTINTNTSREAYSIEDNIVQKERFAMQTRKTHANLSRPIFVEVDEYKQILENIGHIRNDIKESENILIKLQDIKTNKEKEFEKWHKALEDVERKLLYVDKTLFEE